MTDLLMTPIKIAYIHPNGDRQPLGLGDITVTGEIIVTEALDGQDEYLKGLMTELNNRTYIVTKEPPPPGAERFSLGKRKIERDNIEFILEFAAYAERVLSLELDFDVSALAPAPVDVILEVEPTAAPPADPNGPLAIDADDPDDIDPDAQQILPDVDETPAPERPSSAISDEGEEQEPGEGLVGLSQP